MTIKLKKNLRFTDQMRHELARAVAKTQTKGASSKLRIEEENIAIGIYEIAHELTDMPRLQGDNGALNNVDLLLPTLRFFSVNVDDVPFHINLGDDTPVPFLMFADPELFFQEYCDEFHDVVEDFARRKRQAEATGNDAEAKIYEFIKGISSPAKVLDVCPELAQYFPEDWIDPDAADYVITVEGILNAA